MPFDCGGSIDEIIQSGLKNKYVNAASNSIVTAIILVAIIMIIAYVHVRDKVTTKYYISMTFYVGIFTIFIIGLNHYIVKASARLDQEKSSSPAQLIQGNGISNPKYHFAIHPNLEPTSEEAVQNNYHQGFTDHGEAGYREADPFVGGDIKLGNGPTNNTTDLDARSYISNIKHHTMPI